jgi:polysaccharide biosynthesis/export protein
MKRSILALLVPLCLGACATGNRELGGPSGITVIDATSLPAPDGVDVNATVRSYRIGPFDELLIDVYGFQELHERKIVADSAGRISIPIAGDINAMDRTLEDVEREIVQRLRIAHVRNPVVAVNLSEARSRRITVDGEVELPGLYPVMGRMSLMQAVASARGATEYARLEDVVVFRSVNGQRMAALYNLQAIRRGAYPDPEVFANDVVVVGDSPGRRLFQSFIQLTPLLASPIVAVLQN